MASKTRKKYFSGTHRTIAPARTLERFGRFAGDFGITRLADVTGLDYLNIPVFMAIRPNARSLSVSQGKGVDEASARTSAFMEGAELWHAEHAEPSLDDASWAAMEALRPIIDFPLLPRVKYAPLRKSQKLRWTEAADICSGETVALPFELVHMDFRVPFRSTPFLESSNGLASGNHMLEATCSALCEVIERDGLACWQSRGPKSRAARRTLLDSISDENCNLLLERLAACDMDVAIWNLTTDIGVPVFLCRLSEASQNERSQHGEFWGCGCHSTTGIALIRAITEAVQTRLTYIAGSRDDLRRRHYSTQPRNAFASSLELWERTRSGTLFSTVPGEHNANFEEDLASLLRHLRAAGLSRVLRVDLTNERFGIPVVRIVVPGLETWTGESREVIGARAKAVGRTAQ